jgi:hypothetical protein
VFVSGILGGLVINGKGTILGDMIAFTDDDAFQKLNESYLNLTTEWDGLKATINFADGRKVIYPLQRRGVAEREQLLERRFTSTDGQVSLCVYGHHYSDIRVSGYVQGMIMDAAGAQNGDVLEFNDNTKGAYMAGRFVVSDDWTSMRGTITYEDGHSVEVELPASSKEAGYTLNDSRYANIPQDQTLSFYGAHYAAINLSGIVGDENIVCVGEVHGDVVIVNNEPENPRFMPSRLVLRNEGKVLEGGIVFKPVDGIKVNMTRVK